jgi:hypothetical protein
MLTIPPATALRIAQRLCAASNVALVMPTDLRRKAVIELVILARDAAGDVDAAAVRKGTTVTLPGAPGPALALLALVPVVGPALVSLTSDLGRTTIYLAPDDLLDGVRLLRKLFHEMGHVGSIAVGGLGWCLAYLIAAEARAGGEAPCFGAGMAVEVACGRDVAEVADEAKRSLAGYALDDAGRALARGIIDSAAATIAATGDYGGIVGELRAALAVEGISL